MSTIAIFEAHARGEITAEQAGFLLDEERRAAMRPLRRWLATPLVRFATIDSAGPVVTGTTRGDVIGVLVLLAMLVGFLALAACTHAPTRPETPLPAPQPCALRPAPARAHWRTVGPPVCPEALVCLTPADAEALVGEVEDRRRWDGEAGGAETSREKSPEHPDEPPKQPARVTPAD